MFASDGPGDLGDARQVPWIRDDDFKAPPDEYPTVTVRFYTFAHQCLHQIPDIPCCENLVRCVGIMFIDADGAGAPVIAHGQA